MWFNSIAFVVFATAFFSALPLCSRACWSRNLLLVGASLFFYGWWDVRFVLLIPLSATIDYVAALSMARWEAHRRLFLAVSVVANLTLLGTFKYASFVLSALHELLGNVGGFEVTPDALPTWMTILPVGISFYTFQSMSYTIDVFRGRMVPTRNFLGFLAYLSMFPQLVAGPIVRAKDLLPQVLTLPRRIAPIYYRAGAWMILLGFVKKMVFADNLAPYVDAAYSASPSAIPGSVWIWATMLFAVQIYCDFSGYSDIAIGLGLWMGFRFPQNFAHPYAATSLRDFWSRWHISLSTWFRDYVYIPLGGSRRGRLRAHLAMWATMVLSGLWHGAAWTFVVWGVCHAAFLSVERESRGLRRLATLPSAVRAVLVLTQVVFAWVFFRADSLEQSFGILKQVVSGPWLPGFQSPFFAWPPILLVAGIGVWEFAGRCRERGQRGLLQLPLGLEMGLLAAGLLLAILLRGPGQQFIYFQF